MLINELQRCWQRDFVMFGLSQTSCFPFFFSLYAELTAVGSCISQGKKNSDWHKSSWNKLLARKRRHVFPKISNCPFKCGLAFTCKGVFYTVAFLLQKKFWILAPPLYPSHLFLSHTFSFIFFLSLLQHVCFSKGEVPKMEVSQRRIRGKLWSVVRLSLYGNVGDYAISRNWQRGMVQQACASLIKYRHLMFMLRVCVYTIYMFCFSDCQFDSYLPTSFI